MVLFVTSFMYLASAILGLYAPGDDFKAKNQVDPVE